MIVRAVVNVKMHSIGGLPLRAERHLQQRRVRHMGGFNHRILVVDNEAEIRKTAEALLATQGYEVLTAVDGFDGLVQLRRSLPDLIISDLSMPNMSGFELLSLSYDFSTPKFQ